jgi:hypothetical protein
MFTQYLEDRHPAVCTAIDIIELESVQILVPIKEASERYACLLYRSVSSVR